MLLRVPPSPLHPERQTHQAWQEQSRVSPRYLGIQGLLSFCLTSTRAVLPSLVFRMRFRCASAVGKGTLSRSNLQRAHEIRPPKLYLSAHNGLLHHSTRSPRRNGTYQHLLWKDKCRRLVAKDIRACRTHATQDRALPLASTAAEVARVRAPPQCSPCS